MGVATSVMVSALTFPNLATAIVGLSKVACSGVLALSMGTIIIGGLIFLTVAIGVGCYFYFKKKNTSNGPLIQIAKS